jgi:hypothetical protein
MQQCVSSNAQRALIVVMPKILISSQLCTSVTTFQDSSIYATFAHKVPRLSVKHVEHNTSTCL